MGLKEVLDAFSFSDTLYSDGIGRTALTSREFTK